MYKTVFCWVRRRKMGNDGVADGGRPSFAKLGLALGLAAILLAGWLPAVDSGQSLREALDQAAAGSVVEVEAGAVIDLNDLEVVVRSANVTLQGSGGTDLGACIAAGAAGALAGDHSREALAGSLAGLTASLKTDLPDSRIYNSNPQGYRSGLVLDTTIAADERLVILTSSHTIWGNNGTYGGNPDFATIISSATVSNPATVTIQKLKTNASGGLVQSDGITPVATPTTNYYLDAGVESTRTASAYYDRDNLDNGGKGGISAPAGGFSLKNLTFSGTVANIAGKPIGESGASVVYTGLVGSNLTRNAALGSSGMGSVENVAFIDNVVNVSGDAHVVGNSLFFTNRHYPGTTYTYVPNGRGGNGEAIPSSYPNSYYETLDSISGSVFIDNQILADME